MYNPHRPTTRRSQNLARSRKKARSNCDPTYVYPRHIRMYGQSMEVSALPARFSEARMVTLTCRLDRPAMLRSLVHYGPGRLSHSHLHESQRIGRDCSRILSLGVGGRSYECGVRVSVIERTILSNVFCSRPKAGSNRRIPIF